MDILTRLLSPTHFIVRRVGVFIATVAVILLSFQLSYWFTLDSEKVHILSFTASAIAAFLLCGRMKVLPAIISGLMIHYLFVSQRGLLVASVFSFALPLIMALFTELFLWIRRHLSSHNFTMIAISYIGLMMVLYPIANTLSMTLLAYLMSYPMMTELSYYGHAILTSAMTQLVLTPMLYFGLLCTQKSARESLFNLNRAMLGSQSKRSIFYWGWLASIGVVLTVSVFANNFVTSTALSLLLIPVIGIGLGLFGYILPSIFTILVTMINLASAVKAFENHQIDIEMFYGLILLLFSLCVTIFLIVVQAIKNHLAYKEAIQAERKDPYTGLYTLAQLKEDTTHFLPSTDSSSDKTPSADPVLVLIDLTEVTRRVKAFGLAEKSEILKQLSIYLSGMHQMYQQGYIVPFTTTLFYLLPNDEALQGNLNQLHSLVKEFQFNWNNRTITLLEPQVRYAHVKQAMALERTVSQLCAKVDKQDSVVEIVITDDSDHSIHKLSQIQQAFDNDDFELYCQPYRHLQDPTQAALSFEVLLRLPNQQGQVLSPAEFFPLINEFGLEVELDKWVIKQTFKVLQQNISDWERIDRCGINLTAQALTQTDLAQYILQCAQACHTPLNKICFEITESMPLTNEQLVIDNLTQLQSQGCAIALDDFGTGYASFDYLRRIPVDILKIDGSFVQHLDSNTTDRAIVKNISHIAQSMGLQTVAEFVETERHAELLKELDVVYAQGFGIAKPRPLISELKSRFSAQ